MAEPGLLLIGEHLSPADQAIDKIAQFLGVSLQTVAAGDFVSVMDARCPTSEKLHILCSVEMLLGVINNFGRSPQFGDWWKANVHSVFVYSNGDLKRLERLAGILMGEKDTRISSAKAGTKNFKITSELNDFSKVMAGLTVASTSRDVDIIAPAPSNDRRVDIISTDTGTVFVRVEYDGVAVFLSTFAEVVDLDAELTSQNFDVREHFLAAVPVVLYLKWAFEQSCWKAPEINACLIIDDPVLKRSHGFVDFRKLLTLMKRHNFSTNIAFIPWNYRRSVPSIARLFRDNPANYSLSVHGCDHSRQEFGSSDRNWLFTKAQLAIKRMQEHELDTGIVHDRVMVFPQGVFSNAGVEALRHTNLIGAVNNDVVSVDKPTRHVTIRDVWQVAVMRYSTFPIFTRRYPWEGLENFAFDILLGKPALIVIHHDYCSDGCDRLIKFIAGLNQLNCSLTWTNLSEALRRSCRQRSLSRGTTSVEMYGRELFLKNESDRPERYVVTRKESDPTALGGIEIGSQRAEPKFESGLISFETDLHPGEAKVVEFNYRELNFDAPRAVGLAERASATLRRYLCEFRDNYVDPTRYRLSHVLNASRN